MRAADFQAAGRSSAGPRDARDSVGSGLACFLPPRASGRARHVIAPGLWPLAPNAPAPPPEFFCDEPTRDSAGSIFYVEMRTENFSVKSSGKKFIGIAGYRLV